MKPTKAGARQRCLTGLDRDDGTLAQRQAVYQFLIVCGGYHISASEQVHRVHNVQCLEPVHNRDMKRRNEKGKHE